MIIYDLKNRQQPEKIILRRKCVHKFVNARRLTVRQSSTKLTDEKRISVKYCRQILTINLQMIKVAAKFVRQLLTSKQKENLSMICQNLKNCSVDPNFLKPTNTGDETWVYGSDQETKV